MTLMWYKEELITVARKTRLRHDQITFIPRSAGHDITIAFPLRREHRRTYRCRYKCSLVKNLSTYWETREENREINENILAP